jgi:hypothetical protein
MSDNVPQDDAQAGVQTDPLAVETIANKQLRKDLDAVLQRLKARPYSSERSWSVHYIQNAIMWLGMDLKRLNEPNPYPNSRDTSNTTIDPTADGLKL